MKIYNTSTENNVTRVISTQDNFDLEEMLYNQGRVHAQDRYTQMEMLRIVASGEVCNLLIDNDESFAIDKFMRELGIKHYAKIEESQIDEHTLKLLNAYCKGVNDISSKSRPIIFSLTRVPYRRWEICDTIMTIKAMSYIGLASGQQDLEKLLITLIAKGTNKEKVESLVNNQEKISEDVVKLLKDVKIYNSIIPNQEELLKYIPKMQASNNWVLKKNDKVIHACDPHLECNRLPSIWHEMKLNTKDKNFFGISMPGVPGIVMGKSDKFSFSFTYGFMDSIDYFIEDIKNNKYRSDNDYVPFKIRKEVIKRKNNSDGELYIRETDFSTLEWDSEQESLVDGKYLCLAWTCQRSGGVQTLKSITEIFNTNNIDELSTCLSKVAISCNWIITDSSGNIAYQQSGLAPLRKSSGLFPLPSYQEGNKWKGLVNARNLLHFKNPEEGFIVTANNDMTMPTFVKVINAPMASYRHDFIVQNIKNGSKTVEDFKTLQSSSYSIQAELYFNKYKKEFENSCLKHFNFDYSIESVDAASFEKFYSTLHKDFITDHLSTSAISNYIIGHTCITADFYGLFDRLFLEKLTELETQLWFGDKSKNQYIENALKVAPQSLKWGEVNKVDFNYIMLDGKLKAFLTRDQRSVPIKGNRASISQGSVYRSKGRVTSFLPSWKMITEMDSQVIHSVLPGGLSDKIYSKYYKADLRNWIDGSYRETKLK